VPGKEKFRNVRRFFRQVHQLKSPKFLQSHQRLPLEKNGYQIRMFFRWVDKKSSKHQIPYGTSTKVPMFWQSVSTWGLLPPNDLEKKLTSAQKNQKAMKYLLGGSSHDL